MKGLVKFRLFLTEHASSSKLDEKPHEGTQDGSFDSEASANNDAQNLDFVDQHTHHDRHIIEPLFFPATFRLRFGSVKLATYP
eukprot:4645412-Amphidinium_carterae.1